MKIMSKGQDFFVHHRRVSAVKRVKYVSDTTSYGVLRSLVWYYYSEDKRDDSKDNFYEALGQVFDYFRKYHMKILLGDFNTKVRREDMFKLTTGNDSMYQNMNNNAVRVAN